MNGNGNEMAGNPGMMNPVYRAIVQALMQRNAPSQPQQPQVPYRHVAPPPVQPNYFQNGINGAPPPGFPPPPDRWSTPPPGAIPPDLLGGRRG